MAYSGGVDSTFLLKVLCDLHPSSQILAVTAVSATSARQERADAVRFAQYLGAEHLMAPSMEMELPEFAATTPPQMLHLQTTPLPSSAGYGAGSGLGLDYGW